MECVRRFCVPLESTLRNASKIDPKRGIDRAPSRGMDEHDDLPERPPSFEDGHDIRDHAHELVQEGNQLVAIVTAIIRNKRRNVAAKKAKAREEKAAPLSRKAAKPPKRGHEFKIPNS